MYGEPQKALLLSRTAMFVVLITVGGWLSIPFFPVPITLQSLFVLLSGAVMKRQAVLPVSLYLLLGTLNLPLFHYGLSGVGILLGPTGGYLVGFLPAALIVGLAYERTSPVLRIGGVVVGTLTILSVGTWWLHFSTGLPPFAAVGVGLLLFLPGDTLKGIFVYITARRFS